MEHIIREAIKTGSKTALEIFIGRMIVNTMEILSITTFMERAPIRGQTGENTTASGRITRCTVMVFLLGTMEEYFVGIIFVIKRKDMVNLTGQMGRDIAERGRMENSMAVVYL